MTTNNEPEEDKTSSHWSARAKTEEKKESEEIEEPTESSRMEKVNKVLHRARGTLEWGVEEITKISRVGKLKLDLAKLQRERDRAYRKLGEETYTMVKEDRFDPAEIEKYLARIDQATIDIETCFGEVAQTTGKIKVENETEESES